MSPEALIGMELGGSVLQRSLGQGTMGTVYLASHKGRQVAVKVFLPASALEQADQENFRKRLDEVLTWGASLDHPHILSILEHSSRENLVYQVTPYIQGESLAALLDRSGPLPFVQIQHYLEQLAAALDYAHTRGVLHRDLKPGNILLTPAGDVLLTDFGLAGLTTEKNFASVRRAMPGMLNAIAPEYVLNKTVDQRADLYSLGAVLYQMVTGSPPFQGDSLAEVAMKHVRAAPPSPRSLRNDLPQAAEQVMLRALAKRPDDRYAHAPDLASAFRLAIEAVLLPTNQPTNALSALVDLAGSTTTTTGRMAAPRGGGLFDPKWRAFAPLPAAGEQAGNEGAAEKRRSAAAATSALTTPSLEQPPANPLTQANLAELAGLDNSVTQQAFPQEAFANEFTVPPTPTDSGLKGTGLLRFASTPAGANDQLPAQDQSQATQPPDSDGSLRLAEQQVNDTEGLRLGASQIAQEATGPLPRLANNDDTKETKKLTESVKIIQMPVAGQPGRFVTGFLPAVSPEQTAGATKRRGSKRLKIASLLLAVLVVAAGAGAFWALRGQSSSTSPAVRATPDLNSSATARASATTAANIIYSDNLSQNTRNWPEGSQGWYTCAFEDGAYHITNNDKHRSAPALLPGETVNRPFTYTLTMEQIKGDLTSPNNQFGMILNAAIQTVNGKQIDRFYAFEIVNKAGGQYQFWKYDNSKNSKNGSPWTTLWTKNFGKEFKQGSGPSHVNTVKVIASGTMFTFIVNGKQVGTWKDSSFSTGSVGMLVNLNGAEVAFSNLLLTYS